MSTEKCW